MKSLFNLLVLVAMLLCLVVLVWGVIYSSPGVQAALDGGGVEIFLELLSGS